MESIRQIIHIDMDAFYAAIEQRDNPTLKGMPVCVGGNPKLGRGVVMTCSYEARKYGIHSAMPAKTAVKLCPHAIFVKPRFEVYVSESEKIKIIFHRYSNHVQPLSLDEAYLDISDSSDNFETSELITKKTLKEITEKTGLTASAGVSFNKFLAKVGSDFNKPNGITVITLETADEFIDNLPIGKFYGIGKKTEQRMISMGITTGRDLKNFGLSNLKLHFGKAGKYYYNCAIGEDEQKVNDSWQRKSMGHERTLREDIDDKSEMLEILSNLANKISDQLNSKDMVARTIILRLRYSNYQRISKTITLHEYTADDKIIMIHIKKLLRNTDAGKKKVRLLGVAVSNIKNNTENRYKQDKLNFL
jgi:DNA polymerase-4